MVEDLYRQGAELIRPYFHLIDKGHADPSTPQGKRELRDGISKLEAVVKLARPLDNGQSLITASLLEEIRRVKDGMAARPTRMIFIFGL